MSTPMSDLRFSDVTVKIQVDGEPQVDTFERITEWAIDPEISKQKMRFAGKKPAEYDSVHDGWKYSFTCQVTGRSGFDYINRYGKAQKDGKRNPVVSLTWIFAMRDGSTIVYRMRSSDMSPGAIGKGGEYITMKFDGNSSEFTEQR